MDSVQMAGAPLPAGRIAPQAALRARAWAEIDLAALRQNARALQELLPEGCALMPALKADAYGLGAPAIAGALYGLGIRAFCVATAQEAAVLRKSGIGGTLLVLGYTHPALFPLLAEYRLTQTIFSEEYARQLASYGRGIHTHIKIDTGLHRLGEPHENTGEVLRMLACKGMHVTGIYSHLAAADSRDAGAVALTQAQIERFFRLLRRLEAAGYRPDAHLQGSYGLLNYPVAGCRYARVGNALYGAIYQEGLLRGEEAPRLRPVLSLKARVTQMQTVPAGESIGYGLGCIAKRDTRAAVLSIGYADGVPFTLANGRGYVLLRGRRAPILGKLCMDQMMVDATDIPEAAPGGEAVLLGASGEEHISVPQLAALAGSVPSQVMGALGGRVERMYLGEL